MAATEPGELFCGASSHEHTAPNKPAHRFAFVNGGLGFGGATTILCHLGGELVRRGVPVLAVGMHHANPFAREFHELGVQVEVFDERKLLFEERVERTLHTLEHFRPTAVVAGLGASSFEVLRYVPQGVTRVLMVQADEKIHYDPAVHYGPFVDAVVGVSEKIRERLAAMPAFQGVPAYSLTSGVALPETFKPRRSEPGSPLRILYLGRLDRVQKRVHLFPEILAELKKAEIPFIWTIAGEGPDTNFLTQHMRTERADQRVLFAGAVPHDRVPTLLEQNDILLLASDYEGLPLCVLEGMACGLVPVVSDLPSGIRELLNESEGMRIPVNNISAYAQAMADLYRHPEKMEQLSRNAREKIQREFSCSVMADRWLKTFSPGPQVDWPTHWKILPPLVMNQPIYFSPPARFFRKFILRLRHGWN